MRGFTSSWCGWRCRLLSPALAQAQDTEALRRELEQLRAAEQYQKIIDALTER
jgi:hypothetical protein